MFSREFNSENKGFPHYSQKSTNLPALRLVLFGKDLRH